MHWRVTVEAVDLTGEDYRQEFLFEKNLDGLTDGRIGCSVEDGKETRGCPLHRYPAVWPVVPAVQCGRKCTNRASDAA